MRKAFARASNTTIDPFNKAYLSPLKFPTGLHEQAAVHRLAGLPAGLQQVDPHAGGKVAGPARAVPRPARTTFGAEPGE